jgi:hypothetical protein
VKFHCKSSQHVPLTTATMLFRCSVLQHLATKELYAISKELNVRAETLIEQYSPDLTPAFKEWLVAELRKHHEVEQRSQAAQTAPAVHPSADSEAAVLSRPAQQSLQQHEDNAVAGGAPVPAAAAATGRGGGGGSGLQALRARMNQLQAKCNPLASAHAPAHNSAPGALVGASSCSELPAMAKAAGMAAPVLDTVNAISDGGIGVGSAGTAAAAGQQPGGGCSIDEIKSRFHSMHKNGQ